MIPSPIQPPPRVIDARLQTSNGTVALRFNTPPLISRAEMQTFYRTAGVEKPQGVDARLWKVISDVLLRQGALFVTFMKHPNPELIVGVAAPEEYDATGMMVDLGRLIDQLHTLAGKSQIEPPLTQYQALCNTYGPRRFGPQVARQQVCAELTIELLQSLNDVVLCNGMQ